MRGMTTEQLQPEPAERPNDRATHPRRLRRRQTDRVIGGVAGGLADYLNVDPLLVRAVFAGLMLFGATGIVTYLLAWFFIPLDGRDRSVAEDAAAGLRERIGRGGIAVLVFLAIVVAGSWLSGHGPGQRFRDVGLLSTALVTTAFIVLGMILLRSGNGSRGGPATPNGAPWAPPASGPLAPPAATPPADSDGGPAATTSAFVAEAPPAAWQGPAASAKWGARPEPRPRERSPLAWYVGAATLVVVALLALAGIVTGAWVTPGQYLGAVLAVFGVGLLIAAWWGRAGILIVLGTVLLPVAILAAFVSVPLSGGLGDVAFRPQTPAELRGEYRIAAGGLTLDLTALPNTGQPIAIAASVGVGRLLVLVPADARLQIDGRVNGGRLSLPGSRQVGTWLAERVDRPDGTGVHLVLTLEAGLGGVTVETAPAS